MVGPMAEHLKLVTVGLRQAQSDITQLQGVENKTQGDLKQILAILNGAIVRINDLQSSVDRLEIKVGTIDSRLGPLERKVNAVDTKIDEHIASLRRDLQKLNLVVHNLGKQAFEAVAAINRRLDIHENTPLDAAHPRSHIYSYNSTSLSSARCLR